MLIVSSQYLRVRCKPVVLVCTLLRKAKQVLIKTNKDRLKRNLDDSEKAR